MLCQVNIVREADMLNSNQTESNVFKYIMNVNSFDRLDPGDLRTSTAGVLLVHREQNQKFFAKPVSRLTRDSQASQYFDLSAGPMMALFVGHIFQSLMKGRAPYHYLIDGVLNKNNNYRLNVSIGSKFLDNFNTLKNIASEDKSEFTKIQEKKGLHRYLAATIILSNYDVNITNFGLIKQGEHKGKVAGIDLDASLSDCFDRFQSYFYRFKYNTQFSSLIESEEIDVDEIYKKLRDRVDCKKLLKRLDNACDIIENNLDSIQLHLKEQENAFLKLSTSYLEKHGQIIIFQDKPYVVCCYNKHEKAIKFNDGKTLAEKILSILEKQVEIARKSSKILNIAAEICKNKIEDCINLIDKYVKLHDEKDTQVGEASHFLSWLEVSEKIDTNLAVKLKSKYSVSVNDLQNDNFTTASHPLNTSKATTPIPKQHGQSAPQASTPFSPQPVILNDDNNKKNNDDKSLEISPRGWIIIATVSCRCDNWCCSTISACHINIWRYRSDHDWNSCRRISWWRSMISC